MPGQHFPNWSLITQTFNYGNKKDVGVCLSRAYPKDQAFALPPSKDKQRKACPRQ